MSLYNDVMSDVNGLGRKLTTRAFIDEQRNDMITFIKSVEDAHHVVLIGERSHLNDVYSDCQFMTNIQVVYHFAQWRNTILSRYS